MEKCVLQYADQWKLGEEFITWIKQENIFCSTLVDRIVTGYPRNEAASICEELGYQDNIIDTEMCIRDRAIQSGTQTLAAAYNDKVSIDLQQYKQVGAAVTYAVTSGINGAVPQVQMEQTSFAPGQEVAALITDANGNVTAVTIIVGANGIIQYQIPGVNCIVRFMCKI